jgi:DNA-binding CsgD family transcriptional regulator
MEALTTRERGVLLLLADGHSLLEISRMWHLEVSTVKTHAKRLYHKLGATNAAHAVVLGCGAGHISVKEQECKGMEEAFMVLYRQAEMARQNAISEKPVRIYFECARAHLRPIAEASRGLRNGAGPSMIDPAAIFGFPVCINDQLNKPRLVIEAVGS